LTTKGAERPPPIGLADRDAQFGPGLGMAADAVTVDRSASTRAVGLVPSRGRHAAPPTAAEAHAKRFTIFSAIGGVVFVMGLALQALLTGHWHIPPLVSYLAQAIVSVEASFLLNRWLTWRDRDTPLWTAFARFNAQKAITITLNFVLYACLLRLGMNYLAANVLLTIVFTVVNYAAGDRLVFSPRKARSVEAAAAEPHTVPLPAIKLSGPDVSVVIPVRNNEGTIGAAIQSLLDQDYAHLAEIILIGGPDDTTWDGLDGLADPRLTVVERIAPPGMRDANFKRDVGITMAKSELVALVDSDIVLPSDWMSKAVTAMQVSGVSCVAGGMKSIYDSFWGRYTDNTVIGAKTPRIAESYVVNSENFGVNGRKPPITANALFTRELYDRCGIDATWSHGSLEDYEWFWRVTSAGYSVLVSRDLFGWHHHRRGMRALVKEYRRSARGCAYFIRTHLDCPFSRRRLRQAVILPLGALAGTVVLAGALAGGETSLVTALIAACMGLLAAQQIMRMRRIEAVAYPVVGLALGVVYTAGLIGHLLRVPRIAPAVAAAGTQLPTAQEAPAADASLAVREPALAPGQQPDELTAAVRRGGWRLLPLAVICAVQAALSLTLVWSNTAYIDEADYLWLGHLVIGHWLHGTPWPSVYGQTQLSGSPLLYPPIGALADSLGGLTGARILSLVLMLGATILLYRTAKRLFDSTTALFACGIWAVSEPVMRLAFATYDPLSIFLVAVSATLIVDAAYHWRHGELVAASGLALALSNATAYSGVVIDPVVIAFAFFVWRHTKGTRQAWYSAAWFTAALFVIFGLVMTFSRSWAGAMYTVFNRQVADNQSLLVVLENIATYSGLVIGLAVLAALVAIGAERRIRTAQVVVLAAATLVVPAAQLYQQTGWSLDKHLAYGLWFGSMAAGFGVANLARSLEVRKKHFVALCCAAALIYPAATDLETAWSRFQSWPNADSFVAAFRPVAAQARGLIYVPGHEENIAQYYTPQGSEWTRWNESLALKPSSLKIPVAPKKWESYYANILRRGQLGVLALFYTTTFSSATPGNLVVTGGGSNVIKQLLNLAPGNPEDPGLAALTNALRSDPEYRLVAIGPYDTTNLSGTHDYGTFAIWAKQGNK
jgi:putative flippase GtrA/glycosyltransferase involved in cell wall biosynthesis